MLKEKKPKNNNSNQTSTKKAPKLKTQKIAKSQEKKDASKEKVASKKAKNNPDSAKSPKKKSFNIKYLGGLLFAKMVRGGTSELRSNAEEVNKLNVFPVPDGDTGDNMRMTIESGIAAIEHLDTDDLADVMKLFSHGMLLGARGNSGVILSQLFAGMAKGLETESQADPPALARALEMGVDQAYTSVMTPTEGTILTVAREAVEYAVTRLTPKSTIKTLFADLVKEMHASLDRTPEMLSALKEAGVVDSGGAGLFYIMDGFNRVLNGEDISDGKPITAESPKTSATITPFGPDSTMTYGYCTEFLLQLQTIKTNIETFSIEPLKQYLSKTGDSIVVFKNDSIVKVHIHTKCPERVLAYARRYGEFLTVKIENMSVQHSDILSESEKKDEAQSTAPRKRYGIVAVSNGDGITSLMRDFGADEIVTGGQTNNPSTADFISAYEKINAEHIFVFPNNSNIIMAAEQSAEIYEKAKIHVIPAKNIGAGYAAISSLDFECESVEQITDTMNAAINRITTAYVSPSIRDTDSNGIHINNGDTIGIINKEIVVSSPDKTEAVFSLVEKLLSAGDKFMLTVFYGKDSSKEEREIISTYLHEHYPALELYIIAGLQEIYPYIFVAE